METLIQRRFQYQQLIPQATVHHQFIEMSSNTQKQPLPIYNTEQRNTVKPKLNRDCLYCDKQKVRKRESRSKKGDQAQNETPQNERQEQTERPKFNSKLVCQNCGSTGHTARNRRHKRKEASAYRNVPYQKQVTKNNEKFCKNFKKSYKNVQINEASEQPNKLTSSGSEDKQCSKKTRHAIQF